MDSIAKMIASIIMITASMIEGEFDLEHRQSGTSHSVLPSLQKVSGSDDDKNDDDDDDGGGVDDDGDDEV